MSQIIVFKNPDGSCGVVHPSPNAGISIEEIAKKDVPARLPFRITHINNLPKDRYFRGAWTDDNSTETVDVHMDKARQIHLEKIRFIRTTKFKELGFPVQLDTDLEKAIIPENTRNKLQALRDIPQNLDLSIATTPEELKSIWPEELKEGIHDNKQST